MGYCMDIITKMEKYIMSKYFKCTWYFFVEVKHSAFQHLWIQCGIPGIKTSVPELCLVLHHKFSITCYNSCMLHVFGFYGLIYSPIKIHSSNNIHIMSTK